MACYQTRRGEEEEETIWDRRFPSARSPPSSDHALTPVRHGRRLVTGREDRRAAPPSGAYTSKPPLTRQEAWVERVRVDGQGCWRDRAAGRTGGVASPCPEDRRGQAVMTLSLDQVMGTAERWREGIEKEYGIYHPQCRSHRGIAALFVAAIPDLEPGRHTETARPGSSNRGR